MGSTALFCLLETMPPKNAQGWGRLYTGYRVNGGHCKWLCPTLFSLRIRGALHELQAPACLGECVQTRGREPA